MKRTKGSSIKYKVRADVKSQRDEKRQSLAHQKEQIKEKFKHRYDLLNTWHPSKDANLDTFRSLPKDIYLYELSLSALAVYVVLCCRADYRHDKYLQVSLENLKKMTGLSIPTINKGIEELITESELLSRRKHTEGKRTFWTYKPLFIKESKIEENKGNQFFFYTYIVESGLWSELCPRAKALYIGMRNIATFDFMEYCDVEDIEHHDSDEVYKNRKWELCVDSIASVCDNMGISDSNIHLITHELEDYNLIFKTDAGYLVYLKPSDTYM